MSIDGEEERPEDSTACSAWACSRSSLARSTVPFSVLAHSELNSGASASRVAGSERIGHGERATGRLPTAEQRALAFARKLTRRPGEVTVNVAPCSSDSHRRAIGLFSFACGPQLHGGLLRRLSAQHSGGQCLLRLLRRQPHGASEATLRSLEPEGQSDRLAPARTSVRRKPQRRHSSGGCSAEFYSVRVSCRHVTATLTDDTCRKHDPPRPARKTIERWVPCGAGPNSAEHAGSINIFFLALADSADFEPAIGTGGVSKRLFSLRTTSPSPGTCPCPCWRAREART